MLRGADEILLLMSDGWISREGRNIQQLEMSIREQSITTFGIELPLRIKGHQW